MRIAFAILAAGLTAGVPAMAQTSAVAPKALSSLRPTKSGIMTVGGKSFPVFSLQGGDLVADVVPSKPGQPMHIGPAHYEPLHISVDAEGLMSLKAAVDALLSGTAAPFDASILYNGRKLTISSARLSGIYLPVCKQGKTAGDLINLSIAADKVTVAAVAEPAQSQPSKLTTCTVTLAGMPANSIDVAAPGPSFSLPLKDPAVGEMRDYEDGKTDPLKTGNMTLIENSDAPGLAEWARNDMLKGIGETKNLQIVYASAAGPVVRVNYGKALARRVTLDLDAPGLVTFATENPAITKP